MTADPLPPAAQPSDAEPVVSAPSPLRPLLLAAFVVACVFVVRATPLADLTSVEGVGRFRESVAGLGAWAPLAFACGVAVAVAVGVPRVALAALAGAIFGAVWGTALAQAGTIVGCLITFLAGRWLAREWVGRVVAARMPRLGALRAMIGRHGFAANVLLRAAPVGNCFATNLLMSVSPVRARDFLGGSFVGMLPETVIFALLGSAAGGDASTRLIVGASLFAALAVGVFLWVRRSGYARAVAGDAGAPR